MSDTHMTDEQFKAELSQEYLEWSTGPSLDISGPVEEIQRLCEVIVGLRARIAELEGAQAKKTWRCFFCDEVFDDEAKAALHFGAEQMATLRSKPSDKPACTFTIEYVRDLELQLDRYRNEDSDLDRKHYAMEADHQVALRREEEKGYERGRRDAKSELEGARAKAIGKPDEGFARDEEWLRELSCEIAGQDISATVDAVGYAMDELDRRASIIAAKSAEISQLCKDIDWINSEHSKRAKERAAELERLKWKVATLADELKAAQLENRKYKTSLAHVHSHVDDVWFWQGDGTDHLESLICPVVMTADKLRELLDRAPATQAEHGEAWPVADMSDSEISAELDRLEKLFNEPREGGGSPGEWMVERMGELETEQKRREQRPAERREGGE